MHDFENQDFKNCINFKFIFRLTMVQYSFRKHSTFTQFWLYAMARLLSPVSNTSMLPGTAIKASAVGLKLIIPRGEQGGPISLSYFFKLSKNMIAC